MNFEWENIEPANFEKFVYHLIINQNFKNVQWFGRGGGDKGRDVIGDYIEELPLGITIMTKWIFQCKRWRRMPSKNDILNEISKVAEHHPDYWVLVIPVDPNANFHDFLKQMEANYNFKLFIIPLIQIEKLLSERMEYREVLVEGKFKNSEGNNNEN